MDHDRVCGRCGLAGAPLDAYVKASGCKYGRRHLCKPCNAERIAGYQALPRWLLDGICSGPCMDCGMWPEDPCQMDLDHVWGEKVDNVASMIRVNSLGDMLFEVSKCDLVCANCHRLRTYA